MATWKREIKGFQEILRRCQITEGDWAEARSEVVDLLKQQPEYGREMSLLTS